MIKQASIFLLLLLASPAYAQDKQPAALKSNLLDQLRSTHNQSDWFVCADVAVAGLTPEQASWTDGKGNHSVGQLTYHLVFWNERQLEKLTGQKQGNYSGNNDETFNNFDTKSWSDTVKRLDAVLTALEKLVENADEAKLKEIAPGIAHVNTHNAYHIGQIVFVRKEQGSWDASKGVK